jgi:FixJ family two-component response regulator
MNEITQTGTVFIVDDDDAVRDSLDLLLTAEGFDVSSFESGDAFLEANPGDTTGCILLDIRMPGTSGIEVQDELVKRDSSLPIIFITGHGDVPMAVEAMHKGAFDFIQKPFHNEELMERVGQALAASIADQDINQRRQEARERYTTLTPREREVMDMVAQGAANKVIAMDLELSQRTVEIHRSRVMEKMGARSLAALVKMAVLNGEQAE